MIIPKDIDLSSTLAKRYTYCDNYGYCYYSSWYTWQRWVVLGVVIVAAFIAFLLCACCTNRRRRSRGLQPYYGTGWASYGPPPAYDVNRHNQQHGNTGPQYGGYTNPPPQNQNYNAYDQRDANQGSAGGYYGGQPNNNYEMPQYGGTHSGPYAPPASPPPSHVKH